MSTALLKIWQSSSKAPARCAIAVFELSGLHYTNRLARWFLLAIEDALGKGGLEATLSMGEIHAFEEQLPPDNLKRQFDFAFFAAINHALEEMYGVRGGRGMALRIGRSWFNRGFQDYGLLAGVAHPAFQALPGDKRVEMGLQALATVLTQAADQPHQFRTSAEGCHFVIHNSPMAWGRSSDKPVCHAWVGLLQGCLHYASGGFEYHVYEQACSAVSNDDCVFVINRKPIGQSGS
jgi:predicted hydrocarbon binding protein